ncbi:hypothetical protein Scep_024097 [Stephania cephalantha]|uniref:Uncharacterized protein n=1 Tax=Stephania cephalantha TaxID=152367 RepID=A0AAP0F1C3_9MAGN
MLEGLQSLILCIAWLSWDHVEPDYTLIDLRNETRLVIFFAHESLLLFTYHFRRISTGCGRIT